MIEEKCNSRVYVFSEDVNDVTAGKLIQRIYDINAEDEIKEDTIKNYTRKPFKIVIESYGGSAHSCIAILAAMAESKTPIHTHCGGYAMSAGAKILMAGRVRTANKMATIMLHDMSASTGYGYMEDISRCLKQSYKLRDQIFEFIVENSDISMEELMQMSKDRVEMYLTAQEAFDKGVIDKVIG